MNTRFVSSLIGALALLAVASSAVAQVPEKSAGGFVYVTGGVSAEELQDLAMQKQKYSLWVTTAARSGAYLSDVQLRILDPKKQAVLDTMIIGPWLMVDLPVGVYTVEAKFNGQTLTRTTHIHPGDHHQVVLYFDTPDKVSPDWVSPFRKSSPYSS